MAEPRERVAHVFRFLQALHQHRNPVSRLVREQPWFIPLDNLPDHPAVELVEWEFENDVAGEADAAEVSSAEDDEDPADDYAFKVRRPSLTPPPAVPDGLADWMDVGWDDSFEDARVIDVMEWEEDDGTTKDEQFNAVRSRVDAFGKWKRLRDEWATQESPARKAYWFYQQLYELHKTLQRESESMELVLGDGVLKWGIGETAIDHPILLVKVQLSFDPSVPEFTIACEDAQCELYTALLRSIPDVDGDTIQRFEEELGKGDYHPLAGDETTDFLRRVVTQLSMHGSIEGEASATGISDAPQIARRLVLFLRKRSRGFADAISAIVKGIESGEDVPSSLMGIVGSEQRGEIQPANDAQPDPMAGLREARDVLLGKPANAEQIRIARLLESQGSVLVQGPPGTGKSHTIANLIGHTLAKGESILVTAHTTKALSVLRQHLPEPLRPLCVSVLERDMESRMQLEGAVQAIAERISTSRPGEYDQKAEKLAAERERILDQLDAKRDELYRAVAAEYSKVSVGGEEFAPADAAAKLAEEAEQNGWIPGTVAEGDLPLTSAELTSLYASNMAFSSDDEAELAGAMPVSSEIPSPDVFAALVDGQSMLRDEDRSTGATYWSGPDGAGSSELSDIQKKLEKLGVLLSDALESVSGGSSWRLNVISAGYKGDVHREPWDALLAQIRRYCKEAAEAKTSLLEHDPQVSRGDAPDEDLLEAANGILERLKSGGKLGAFTRLFHPAWRYLLSHAKVMDRAPKTVEQFEAIGTSLRLDMLLDKLKRRWDKQVAELGGPSAGEITKPEDAFRIFGDQIKELLSWRANKLEALREGLAAQGYNWAEYAADREQGNTRLIAASEFVDLDRVRETLLVPLGKVLEARANEIRLRLTDARLSELSSYLTAKMRESRTDVAMAFSGAVDVLQKDLYTASFMRLRELEKRAAAVERRHELVERLSASAPEWAAAIKRRNGVHGAGALPGDVAAALRHKRTAGEIQSRHCVSVEDIQRDIADLGERLRPLTVELIISRAWAHQLARAKDHPQQKQSLIGWLDTMKRIGAGTGKRADSLNRQLRELMGACKEAVPIWVMPLSRVPENFDFTRTRFDVVIIDEASQSDVMALMALWLAKKVVIVGDHEQVSPSGVGQDVDSVEQLIHEHLDGVPNAHLYDGRMSVYDLARQSFGQSICLLEHFRCAPDIIGFSNLISYNGQIRPLRDTQQITLRPSTVAHRVKNATANNKVNEDEAFAVAGLVIAASEQPEYDGLTMGVISMVGEDQALQIERLVLEHLEPREVERRRIISGNPAQFQGDERDVMFISMVDSPSANGGALPRRAEDMYRQRFNVAASRAKDQMWVVHSLDVAHDLKDGDLRRMFIEYADRPESFRGEDDSRETRRSSKLAEMVKARLNDLGYRVQERFRVGYFSIDLVVHDSRGRRLAVVCDGAADRTPEEIVEDLARQATLERLGWNFSRVRASLLFSDPEQAMCPVVEQIKRLGIEAAAGAAGAASDTPDAPVESCELVDRVVKRSRDLVKRWKRRKGGRGRRR